jgi:hypothetical protein
MEILNAPSEGKGLGMGERGMEEKNTSEWALNRVLDTVFGGRLGGMDADINFKLVVICRVLPIRTTIL